MDGITIKITGTLIKPFDDILVELPRAEKRALYRAAYFLRDKIQQSLVSSVPKAIVRNPKYIDTLVDAVGFSKVDGASTTVHAMGNRKHGGGTFRARFFEEGTKDRFHIKHNGIKLKKRKSVGSIKPTHFFSSAVNANRYHAVQLMREVLSEYVDEAFKNNI